MPRHPLLVLSVLLASLGACHPSDATPAGGLGAGAVDPVAIPPRGSESRLDVASWNVEWFGSPANGPVDDGLQVARVRDVIRGTDADIWGLVEVVEAGAWNALLAGLPGYSGVLASDAQVSGGSQSYSRDEQKVGVVFKSEVVTVTGARVVLRHASGSFAGRPPLEIRMRVSIAGDTASLVLLVVHMKAFADETSRQRRETSSHELKAYLDSVHPTGNVIVVGDWNDDVDVSIVPRRPTPYATFAADTARYRFVTSSLSARGISSTTGFRDLVDHHLASDEMAAREVPGRTEVYRVDAFIPDFARTVSDHFPVLSQYSIGARSPASSTSSR